MSDNNLPPIHDAVRLWQGNEAATLRECVASRKRRLPGWTLSWLRESAANVLSGELKSSALRQAVRTHVPLVAQRSVLKGLELLLEFIQKHKWQGTELAAREIACDDLTVVLRPIGKYYSALLQKEYLLAIQPRLEDVPTDEQFRIWHSALHYEFCRGELGHLEVMIVDLSKNEISEKRELRELTSKKLPLLLPEETTQRLDLIGSCYQKAIELVPHLPERARTTKHSVQRELFRF